MHPTRLVTRVRNARAGTPAAATVNRTRLTDAQLEAIRSLRTGENEPAANDPIWAELADLALVTARGTRLCVLTLTTRGELYGAD
jgi:hypothetical protein